MRCLLLILLFSLYSLSSVSQKFKRIFNEKDLSGWKVHGTEKWYVDQKNIVSESGPDKQYGYLATEKSYKNFILTMQFKQESNGNSGVFIRSSLDGVKISGWQVEVAPPGLHTGGIYESYGRGWLIKPNSEDEKLLKADDWNSLKIEVINDKITTWLNGKKIVQLTDEKIGKATGVVALQIHSGGNIKVRWRNIKIKELL